MNDQRDRWALLEDLRQQLHHENCVHDDAGGRFCWSLALIFEQRFATLAAGVRLQPEPRQERNRLAKLLFDAANLEVVTGDPERVDDELVAKWATRVADRLLAAGVTVGLDVERLARALRAPRLLSRPTPWRDTAEEAAALIAAEYERLRDA